MTWAYICPYHSWWLFGENRHIIWINSCIVCAYYYYHNHIMQRGSRECIWTFVVYMPGLFWVTIHLKYFTQPVTTTIDLSLHFWATLIIWWLQLQEKGHTAEGYKYMYLSIWMQHQLVPIFIWKQLKIWWWKAIKTNERGLNNSCVILGDFFYLLIFVILSSYLSGIFSSNT